MNLTLNQIKLSAAAPVATATTTATTTATPAATPAPGVAANSDLAAALPIGGASAGMARASSAAAQPALAFAEWLGMDQTTPPAPADADAAPDEQPDSATAPLLSAMTLNLALLPDMQATLAAFAASLPGMPGMLQRVMTGASASADSETAPADTVSTSGAAGSDASRDARALPGTALAAAETRVPAAPLAAAQSAAPSAVPSLAQSVAQSAAPAASALPASSASATAARQRPAAAEDADAEAVRPSAERSSAQSFNIAAAAAPTTSVRSADTLTLAGPPTAWRQSLQDALGERLHLQVGKNAEQAVIRLEPPQLGRIEIAIRHSAGTLEVQISATHGEVLRQLREVGESLRGDLAQRQFTEVAVNIVPAARGANTAFLGAGDGSGRGRQQDGREPEPTPGDALAEANTGERSFSLNGRG